MLSISISAFDSFDTLPCFSVPFVFTPSSRRKRKKLPLVRHKHREETRLHQEPDPPTDQHGST
ncbi:hypothetical protein Hanom_Chr11g01038011 [Helianthus anomalus]